MKFAIVEDDHNFIDIIKLELHKLGYEDIKAYDNALYYKKDILENQVEYDIVIMDIELNNISGIELAFDTNHILPYCKIIYLTSFYQYSSDVYETDHVYYINKKDFFTYITKAILKASNQITNQRAELFNVSWNKTKYMIKQMDIIYIERNKRVTYIHTNKSEELKTSMKIDIVLNQLNHDFVRSHTSFIINMNYILLINRQEIVLKNGEMIPVSRKYSQDVKKQYNLFLIRHK